MLARLRNVRHLCHSPTSRGGTREVPGRGLDVAMLGGGRWRRRPPLVDPRALAWPAPPLALYLQL